MEDFFNSYLNWWQFIFIAIIIAVCYLVINRYRKIFQWFTGLHNLSLINSLLLVFLIITFVLINPVFHGIIVSLGLLLFYPVLTDYIKGIIVTNNSKIEIGDLISIGENSGKVSEVNLAGIKLLSSNNNLFIPFRIIGNEPIEKYKTDQSRYIQFNCNPEDSMEKNPIQLLEKTIFDFPFLEYGSSIEINQIYDGFQVNVTLANDRFKTSLFNQVTKAGFSIKQQLKQ